MTDQHFWRTMLHELRAAYALLDADQRLVEHDALFAEWFADAHTGLVGRHLFDLLPEFFGQDIHPDNCAIPAAMRVEHVNRALASGETGYFDLVMMPCARDLDAAHLVIVVDVTEQGRYLQELMQSRNDLRLLRRKLTLLNEQLDFLLRHYISPDIAEALVQGTLRPELGGELREVSILFADARDFTAIVETIPAERVMSILNEHLGIIVDAINDYGGTINQFQGDNVMAIFNAHNDQPDHATRAVQAGIRIQQQVFDYQAQRPKEKRWFHFGVGINTGAAIVGNSGARWRYTYTAIGDTTNIAARITAAAPAYEVWISQATYAQLKDAWPVTPLSPMHFKGKGQATALFRVEVPFPAQIEEEHPDL